MFGVLGTATVNTYGFLPSVNLTDGVEVTAIASRDAAKARRYAAEHGIPRAHGAYSALLSDPGVDCVYIPLPNSMHVEWTKKALRAGKHVLCEKPFASNAREAASVAPLLKKSGLVFAEGYHTRYHPLTEKLIELVRGGEIGELIGVEASYNEIIPNPDAVQFRPEFAGGAIMDMGCYGVHFARTMAGCDEAEILKTRSKILPRGVDGETRAELLFANGVRAAVICSIIRTTPSYAVLTGSRGAIFVSNPFAPSVWKNGRFEDQYLCLLQKGAAVKDIRVPRKLSYALQLRAFRDAVLGGPPPITGLSDSLANMRLLDAMREKAGVPIRV